MVKKKLASLVIGTPSLKKANGVLRYCYDFNELLKNSSQINHEIITFNRCDFYDNFLLFPKKNKIKDIIKLKGYDAILFHGVYHPIFLFILLFIPLKSIGIIPHGSFNSEAIKKNKIIKLIFNTLLKLLLKNKKIEFLVTSDQEREGLYEHLSNKFLCKLLGPVINIHEKFLNMRTKKKTTEFLSPNILYCGRLDIHTKGLDTLLRVAELLKDKTLTIQISGPNIGKGFDWIKNEIKKRNLYKVIKLTRALYGIEKIKALNSASLFILLSRNEGMPSSVLEALGYGCPCIVTKETNVLKFSGKYSPVLFVERDEKLIAKEITKLLKDPLNIYNRSIEARRVFNLTWHPKYILKNLEIKIMELIV